MNVATAWIMAFLSAAGYGFAAVLEQVGVRRETTGKSLDVRLVMRASQQLPYVAGMVLDGLGWILSLVAVRALPLFLVQAIISSSVLFTMFADTVFLKTRLSRFDKTACASIVPGLAALGFSATPSEVHHVAHGLLAGFVVTPVILAVASAVWLRIAKEATATFGMAILAGLAFSGTVIVGRIVYIPHNVLLLAMQPTVWALLAYGLLGMILVSLALQRGSATRITSTLFAAEIIVATTVGLAGLHDRVRAGYWPLMVVGLASVGAGILILALGTSPLKTGKKITKGA